MWKTLVSEGPGMKRCASAPPILAGQRLVPFWPGQNKILFCHVYTWKEIFKKKVCYHLAGSVKKVVSCFLNRGWEAACGEISYLWAAVFNRSIGSTEVSHMPHLKQQRQCRLCAKAFVLQDAQVDDLLVCIIYIIINIILIYYYSSAEEELHCT